MSHPTVYEITPVVASDASSKGSVLSGPSTRDDVGTVVHHRLTDEEREAAAYRAGVAMQSWYSRYQQTGDLRALDVAYHHMGQMRQILAGRSAEVVARMERERGLSLPAVANEERA